MEKSYYSIYNDVLGPIMTGPSSSHSAGCARIGKTVRSLFGREIVKADVVFEQQGSYPSTYIGQGSNFGFTGGLLDYSTDDVRLKDAVEIAKAEGREIVFKKAPLGFKHPNQARIDVYGDDGSVEMSVMTFSVGGGMFEITQLDGFDVMMNGGNEQIFILCDTDEGVAAAEKYLAEAGFAYAKDSQTAGTMITVKPVFGTDTAPVAELEKENGVRYVRYAKPVLSVVKRQDSTACFYNALEAEEYNKDKNKALWQLAMDYECSYGYVTEEDVWKLTRKVMEAMRNSTKAPDVSGENIEGLLVNPGRDMVRDVKEAKTVDTGILGNAMLAAIAVMENSCIRNIVVASPTAGSSGVVPAAVVNIGIQMGCSEEEICKGLMAAGIVGVFIANQATFGGEVGACQAENGSASAMAAAGVAQLLGGDVTQCFRAAGMAMQNMLGLICDPVAGMTEIPCISRNVSALSNAVMSANMAMMGFNPVIPLDEVIITMGKVGQQLPAELRCTCEGGLCKTATGCRIGALAESQRPML